MVSHSQARRMQNYLTSIYKALCNKPEIGKWGMLMIDHWHTHRSLNWLQNRLFWSWHKRGKNKKEYSHQQLTPKTPKANTVVSQWEWYQILWLKLQQLCCAENRKTHQYANEGKIMVIMTGDRIIPTPMAFGEIRYQRQIMAMGGDSAISEYI